MSTRRQHKSTKNLSHQTCLVSPFDAITHLVDQESLWRCGFSKALNKMYLYLLYTWIKIIKAILKWKNNSPSPKRTSQVIHIFHAFSIPNPMHTFYLVSCAHTICVLGKALYQPSICWAWWGTGDWRTVKSGEFVSVEGLCPRGSIYRSFQGSVTFLI